MKNVYMQPGKLNRPGVEEQRPGGAVGSDFTSTLETVSQIHITARPELQGMKNKCIFVLLCKHDTLSTEISLFKEMNVSSF